MRYFYYAVSYTHLSRVFTTGLTIQDKKPARREKFLFYEGKYYVLSENRIPYQRDKTHDDRFFILTLFAIVKELEENPQIQPEDVIQVDLPIGLPPKHYAELCERYEAYFKRQGKIHDINYCGRTYHITIGEVMAFPQDYAAMMTMIEKLQQIPKVCLLYTSKSIPEISISSLESRSLEKYLKLSEEKSQLEKRKKEIEAEQRALSVPFVELLGQGCKAVIEDGSFRYRITYNPTIRTQIGKENMEKLKNQHPDIYEEYTSTTESRIFRIKKEVA